MVDIEVRVLGPVEIDRGDGRPDRVHGLAARLLLALIVDRGRSVDDDVLVERLWPDAPPRHAIASIRNQVARLRRSFAPEIIGREHAGYRVGPVLPRLDLDRLQQAVDNAGGDVTDAASSAAEVGRALELVRGRPLHEVADDMWAMPAAVGIAEQVAAAEELWASLILAAGGPVDVARLRRAALAQPHREVRWRQLITALAAAGHGTEALRSIGDARRALAGFGMEPCQEVVEIERNLLGAGRSPATVSRVPARRDPMVGREDALADVLRPGRVVWIEGEAGTGKTRLVAELADRIDPDRSVLLYVACPRVAGAGPGCASALLAVADELVPLARRGVPGGPGDAASDPDVRRAGLPGEVVARLRTTGSEREIVVVVDDVQWVEPSEAALLLEIMMRTLDVARWIVASRPAGRHPAVATLHGELERAGSVRTVELGSLTTLDVRTLLDDVAPELDATARDRLADDVWSATGGHPLSVTELVSHRDRLFADGRLPRLDAIVAGTLALLDAGDRHLVDLLAVAAGPTPVTVLAAASSALPGEVLERAERLLDEGLVGPVVNGDLELRHDLVRRAVERHVSPTTELTCRRMLIEALAHHPRTVVAYADQLLRAGDWVEDASERARAVAAAIRRQLDDADYVGAGRMAVRYLDLAGEPVGTDDLAASLQAATALIASGDAARGRATLMRLREPARSSGDVELLADTILAMGPLMTGGRETDDVIDDAEHLAATLSRGDGYRRVQLACWGAHQLLLRGDRLRAERLLDVADADPYGASSGQGLVLAIRAQADTLVDASPSAARRSLAQLRRFAVERSDVTAEAAALLLGARQAWADQTLAEVAAARDGIVAMGERLPRPDIRWWPAAMDASIALAAGRLDEAAPAIEEAARLGRELRVEAAGQTARVQQLTLLYVGGSLGSVAGGLAHFMAGPDATPALLAGYGLACVEAGDTTNVVAVARRLVAERNLLAGSGASWPLVAMCAGEIAAAACDRRLARALRDVLEPFAGTGLALHSVGYFGTADRCLGKLAMALGDRREASRLFAAAVEQERQRGAIAWERRSVADLWAVDKAV